MSNKSARLEELQVERALFGLDRRDTLELEQLARELNVERYDEMDYVAARAELAMSRGMYEPLPPRLRRKVRVEAAEFFADKPNAAANVAAKASNASIGVSARLAWVVAAAAISLVFLRPFESSLPQLTHAEQRAQWLNLVQDEMEVAWSPGPNAIAGAEGDVVWSPARRQGFMRFRNLPVNDPTREQYQLWIFAKNQSEETPIDGGVFDIPHDGEVVVPIDPKLRADDVYLFAITIEQPGGVVVSSRERLPLLATVEGG